MNDLLIDLSSGDGVIDFPLMASRHVKGATIRATWKTQ